jgi:hypothetical protein
MMPYNMYEVRKYCVPYRKVVQNLYRDLGAKCLVKFNSVDLYECLSNVPEHDRMAFMHMFAERCYYQYGVKSITHLHLRACLRSYLEVE